MISRPRSLANTIRVQMGVDRAIAYTFGARACSIVGSAGTVLLIVHFLSKVEQGYYYTLLSLVNLQIIFELGFSFVVLQLAAHEAIHLQFRPDGGIDGDPTAYIRLVAIFKKTVRWYAVAGLIMVVTLLPSGILFFYRNAQNASAVWLWPWMVAALATVVLFVLNPFCSFLEGCGQVHQVAGMRLGQAVLGNLAAWGCMFCGKGLFAPALVVAGNIISVSWFLWSRRQFLRRLLRESAVPHALSWRTEVWSFQWKIAVTWLCSYFTVQILTPVLFAAHGAVEAGRLGMSLSIAAYMWGLVFPWISTKATPFGQLIAKKHFRALDQLFFRSLGQSVAVLGGLVLACMGGILAVQVFFPTLASRMVSPQLFVLLLITAISTLIVQSEAVYLRAHKEEPLLWQAVIVALLTSAGAYLSAPRWGITGICIVYFVCSGVIGVAAATLIFHVKRRCRRQGTNEGTGMAIEVTL